MTNYCSEISKTWSLYMGENFSDLLKAEKEADQEIIDALEKKVYDLKNLMDIGISLSSNLNFHSLVDSLMYTCIGHMFIEKVVLMMQIDIDKNSFYIHNCKGYDVDYSVEKSIILDEESKLIQFLEDNPGTYEFKQLYQHVELIRELKKLEFLQPELVVTMKSKNSLNGLIILGHKLIGSTFTFDDKEFLKNLSKFAATAVENSRLYLMATHDRMTRLYIHHYFQERLLEEIKRCERYKTPLSIFISDIDHFKKFNDTYGHQQGDIVLKTTADIMKQTVRGMDIPARYGGEEFAVILPETDLEKAVAVANRFRKNVENKEYPGKEQSMKVTISIGVAQFDSSKDKDKKDFIERADKAMYRAKESGRNRVESAQ